LGIGTDFFACSTVKSASSHDCQEHHMSGKVKPYNTIEEWPDVIDDAFGILDDNHWITVASMMTGLPKETEQDVIESIEFIDRIKHHNMFVWV
jgi:hypothetical protein